MPSIGDSRRSDRRHPLAQPEGASAGPIAIRDRWPAFGAKQPVGGHQQQTDNGQEASGRRSRPRLRPAFPWRGSTDAVVGPACPAL